MTDWVQTSEAPRWQSAIGGRPWRRATQLVVRVTTGWWRRRKDAHVSRLSGEWLRAHAIESVKHRNEL